MTDPDSPVARVAVGDALEFVRVGSGLSISQVGSAMGTDARGYGRIVVGERPLLFSEALLAARMLGTTTTHLAALVEQALGPPQRQTPPTQEEIGAVQRQRMHRLLTRLERDGREGADQTRKWLEERYGLGR